MSVHGRKRTIEAQLFVFCIIVATIVCLICLTSSSDASEDVPEITVDKQAEAMVSDAMVAAVEEVYAPDNAEQDDDIEVVVSESKEVATEDNQSSAQQEQVQEQQPSEIVEQPEVETGADDVVKGEQASPFTKYTFTDAQLRGVASLCQQEQGTAQGAAAEASLMANHMDLRQGNAKKYPNTGEGLYNYVRYGKWFAQAAKHMDEQHDLRTDVLKAVRKVLVEGKRTLPGYVNEHDCFSDITSAKNNGAAINVRDRSAYIKNVTIMNNRYGAVYTFYCFPTSTSDPFGYTSEAKRKEIGDFCYQYSAEYTQ